MTAGLPGCVPALDKIARQFTASEASGRPGIVANAEQTVASLEGKQKETGQWYLKAMQKLSETDNSYIDLEVSRIQKLMGTKLSDEKKQQFQLRMNVLESFRLPAGSSGSSAKAEL